MDKSDHVAFWLEQAEHDLAVADALFRSEKYDVSLFFGHLVLEKTLKAAWVRDNEADVPPKTHNLVFLIEHTKLKPDSGVVNLLRKANEFNIEARYPDYRFSFYRLCTREFAAQYLTHIKDTYGWLASELKPK
jgi:HEPN domain-containing protein